MNANRTGLGDLLLRLPLVTLALALAAGLIAFYPDFGQRLAFDRTAITNGELLRLFTGHFVHWSYDHLFWDAVMFVALGAVIEQRSRLALWQIIGLAAAAISAGLWFLQPDVAVYRGLSGIDSALFTAIAAATWLDARGRGQPYVALAALATIAAFLAKVGWELVTGTTLFVDSGRAGFRPLPLVHLIGGAIGFVAAWRFRRATGRSVRPAQRACLYLRPETAPPQKSRKTSSAKNGSAAA